MGSPQEPEDRSAVPQLAADCDVASLTLSPAEGFLLSRIDGLTPWSLLRECGVLPAEEVDLCLRTWLSEGVVQLDGKPETPAAERATSPPSSAAGGTVVTPDRLPPELEAVLDPALDLPEAQQRAVLAFEQRLDQPYTDILGVPGDADAKLLRRAYFKLSKDFHPDRYFRKNLGGFAERLDRVFCRIAEAYEILSDPSARAEMAKSLSPEAASPTRAAGPAAPRLRGRTTPHAFSLLARIQRERRRKARRYFDTGNVALAAEKWAEAAQQLRLAIACDPGNAEYKEPFGEANRRANEVRAERFVREANSRYELGEYDAAYKRYVDALHCRPFDPQANHRAAMLAWRIGHDLKAARDYGARACEMEPENAAYRKTLAQIYAAAELYRNAQREFEQVVKLSPGDEEARLELKRVKKLARSAPRGGS